MLPEDLAMFSLPGGMEWVVILLVGLMLFGRRLPDVARSIDKSIVEFKKGIREVKDDIDERAKVDPAPRIDNASSASTNEKTPSKV